MSVVVVTLVGVVSTMLLVVVALGSLLGERHRVGAVADAAALAAADAAVGLSAEEPCRLAERLARADGTRLSDCVIEGTTITVRAVSTASSLHVEATATAGQPGGSSGPGTAGSKK